jgi:hypothetical protein
VCPDVPSWRELPASIVGVVGTGPWPEFTQHFEYRVVEGIPLAGGPARSVGWVRAREPGPARDAGYIAALIDAWYPAVLVVHRDAADRDDRVHARSRRRCRGLDPDALLLYRGTVPMRRRHFSRPASRGRGRRSSP